MKKLSLLLLAVTAVLIGSAQKINDANAELREAKNYHGIHVSSAFDVYLSQGNEETVAVSAANDKDKERIKVEVKNGVLYVGFDTKGLHWNNGNKKLKAYISFKNIDELEVSGACDVFISGTLKADDLKLNLSGASDLREGKLEVNKLSVDLSGASDVRISGKVMQANIEASGASDFKGFDLEVSSCNARASGASDIKITVTKELSAQASGASDIRYKGEGLIKDVRSSGSSSISKS